MSETGVSINPPGVRSLAGIRETGESADPPGVRGGSSGSPQGVRTPVFAQGSVDVDQIVVFADNGGKFVKSIGVTKDDIESAASASAEATLALSTANSAKTSAEAASAAAGDAKRVADAASSYALGAVTAANIAEDKAGMALDASSAASSKADALEVDVGSIGNLASSALLTATTADEKAVVAKSSADIALSSAESAIAKAESADAKAEDAQDGVEDLVDRVRSIETKIDESSPTWDGKQDQIIAGENIAIGTDRRTISAIVPSPVPQGYSLATASISNNSISIATNNVYTADAGGVGGTISITIADSDFARDLVVALTNCVSGLAITIVGGIIESDSYTDLSCEEGTNVFSVTERSKNVWLVGRKGVSRYGLLTSEG